MAGHSQFKNIMVRKGRQDAKKGKIFTKIIREIISAAKSGMPDVNSNPRLRSAVQWAREENMPRDKIEAAIKRGSGNNEGDNFEALRYEAYGPGGVALIIQALTDNRNRTASEIRGAFTKYGGALGETGSVGFMFDYVGLITYPAAISTEDAMFETATDAGADNYELSGDVHTITTSLDHFASVRDKLEKRYGVPTSAKLIWQPKNTVPVNEENGRTLLKLIEMLEDNDDVQEVFSNFEIPESLITALSA